MDHQECAYDGLDGHGALVRTPEADVGRTLTHDDPENLSLCWFQCALVTSSGVGMASGAGALAHVILHSRAKFGKRPLKQARSGGVQV